MLVIATTIHACTMTAAVRRVHHLGKQRQHHDDDHVAALVQATSLRDCATWNSLRPHWRWLPLGLRLTTVPSGLARPAGEGRARRGTRCTRSGPRRTSPPGCSTRWAMPSTTLGSTRGAPDSELSPPRSRTAAQTRTGGPRRGAVVGLELSVHLPEATPASATVPNASVVSTPNTRRPGPGQLGRLLSSATARISRPYLDADKEYCSPAGRRPRPRR